MELCFWCRCLNATTLVNLVSVEIIKGSVGMPKNMVYMSAAGFGFHRKPPVTTPRNMYTTNVIHVEVQSLVRAVALSTGTLPKSSTQVDLIYKSLRWEPSERFQARGGMSHYSHPAGAVQARSRLEGGDYSPGNVDSYQAIGMICHSSPVLATMQGSL